MQPSARAEAFSKGYEQCRLKAYMPTPLDRPTIGWGDTFNPDGSPVRMGQTWTQQQADASFAARFAKLGAKVASLIGGAATSQAQFDAMCCLADNIGAGNFAGSTVLRKHKGGDYAGAAAAFAMWNKQKGVVLRGLTLRRAAEAAMYRGEA